MQEWGDEHKPAGEIFKSGVFLLSDGFNSIRCIFLLFSILAITANRQVKAQEFAPPAMPQVRPIISETYPTDTDRNAIDDGLEVKAAMATARLISAVTAWEISEAEAEMERAVEVELIFKEQITQRQIEDFLGRGGEIVYIYKAVSYGWNGRIALSKVDALPSLMGAKLALVQEARPMALHLDVATRTGRVRPVWASSFAGNPSGFDGSSTITIAILDTGIDGAHSDLSGRQVYWHDFSSDGAASPVDIIQHGSHVAGIALGSGSASGSGTGTLYYTDTGDLSGVPNGSFYPFAIGLPDVSLTYTSTAKWTGGGSTSLYQVYHSKGVSGGWTSVSSAVAGTSPLTETNTFTPLSSRAYSTALLSNGSSVDSFVITNSVTNYPGVGDGFNKLRGVAPGCNWAAAKVFTNSGSGLNTWTMAAIDEMVSTRAANNIKVMNLSLGTIGDPGIDTTERQKVNTAVNNGIVVVISAGNDGDKAAPRQREVDDPGRAAMALTVAAGNDENQLTDYTSHGFSNPGSVPGQEEDYKPDIIAPGGSAGYYTDILSVDSGSGDESAFADQQSNDYTSMQGTSMSSPFAAGAAALVIDAMQQQGITWDFGSNQHSRYVKMLLCATASETNVGREGASYSPTLQRASGGPNGFPAGKDKYEGYGMINPDAAVEAVSLTYTLGPSASETLGPGAYDRRVWARKIELTQGTEVAATLTVPAGGDFDLYLYSATPSSYGTPVILTSSTQAGNDIDESFNYVPPADSNGLLVVKRISGSGTFVLDTTAPLRTLSVTATAGGTATQPGTGSFEYEGGTIVDLAATADLNYHFVSWTGTAVDAGKVANPTSATTTVTMDGDYTVQANFAIDQRILTSSSTAGGDVTTPGEGTFNYDHGTIVGIVAAADLGYYFVNWSGSGVMAGKVANPNSAGTTITMDSDYTVVANFAINQYLITASAGGNGSIAPSGGIIKDYGSSQLFTATPDAGYEVDKWSVDSVEIQTGGTTYTLSNITAEHTVSVTFKILTYTVTASAGLNGDIVPSGDVTKDYGSSQLFTATPDTGYEVDKWFVDSVEVQTGGTAYTLSSITAGHTVAVTFKVLAYTIIGYCMEPDGNTPVAGVLIETDGDINDVTDVNGFYALQVDYGWSGTVTPVKEWYTFEPNSVTYTGIAQNYNDANYTATLTTFRISGRVLEQDLVTGVNDVNVCAENGGGQWTSRYGGGCDITEPNGYYEVVVDCNWSGAVTPTKYAYAFNEPNIIYTNVLADQNEQDYVGRLLTFAIRGYIKNECNAPIKGVLVDANAGGSESLTDVNGFYEVWVDYAWSGTVTPARIYHTFVPADMNYVEVLSDQGGRNYQAENIYDLDCGGFIGWGDVGVIADNWLDETAENICDFNADVIVNFRDYAQFANVWLTEYKE